MKNGKYAIYKGNEYPIYNGVIENKNAIILISHNKNDIQIGFALSYSEKYMREHNFFTCEKEVPKSEITEAYEIRTYAMYKGFEMGVLGIKDGMVRIIDGGNPPSDEQTNRLLSWGFSVYWRERSWIDYDKYVSLDDPDLQLIEKRTELDISKL